MRLGEIPIQTIEGKPAKLDDYRGKVLLVVNVASKCGLTPQYEGLEKLYEAKRAQGLEILGFPANNFGAQEPGTEAEIASFCSLTYGVTFPMFSKISVKGADQHPLYAALTAYDGTPKDITWNFEKFLIGRDGKVLKRYPPPTKPQDAGLLQDIADAL